MKFPFKKFFISIGMVCVFFLLVKFLLDTCLPARMNMLIFSEALAPPAEVCSLIETWDNSARIEEAYDASHQSWASPTTTPLIGPEGQTIFLFSKDMFKMTVLVSRVPGEGIATFQLILLVLFLSLALTFVWEGMSHIAKTFESATKYQ